MSGKPRCHMLKIEKKLNFFWTELHWANNINKQCWSMTLEWILDTATFLIFSWLVLVVNRLGLNNWKTQKWAQLVSLLGSISIFLRLCGQKAIQYIIIAARFNASVRFGHRYWSTPRGRAWGLPGSWPKTKWKNWRLGLIFNCLKKVGLNLPKFTSLKLWLKFRDFMTCTV